MIGRRQAIANLSARLILELFADLLTGVDRTGNQLLLDGAKKRVCGNSDSPFRVEGTATCTKNRLCVFIL